MSEYMDTPSGDSGNQQKKGSALKMGFAIGCGVIILLIIVGLGVGWMLLKDTIQAFKETEKSAEELKKRFGNAGDYCPENPLRISPERMEAFLKIREALSATAKKTNAALAEIRKTTPDSGDSGKKEGKSLGEGLEVINRLKGALPMLANYLTARNRQFISQGMSPAEYKYIYATAYYSLLGKSPADGAEFGDNIRIKRRSGIGFLFRRNSDNDKKEDSGEINGKHDKGEGQGTAGHIRTILLPVLKCQLKKLTSTHSGIEYAEDRRQLEQEIALLDQDKERIPWRDGLPESLKKSLEPFRHRLEASYSPNLNTLEISHGRHGTH